MRLGFMRIPCKDLSEAERFYSGSLGLNKAFGNAEAGFVGYSLDNAQLMLETEAPGEFECGRYLGFSLYTDDINKVYDDLTAKGVQFSGPPERQFWDGWMTHITDCSGNSFSLVQTGPPPDISAPEVKRADR